MCNWVCKEEKGEGVEGMSRWVIAAPAYCPRNAAAAPVIRGQPTTSLKDSRCQSLRSVLGLCSISSERKSPPLLSRANARPVILWRCGARDGSHCEDFTESSYFQPMCQPLSHYLPLSLVTLRPKFIQLNFLREQIFIFLLASMGKGWEHNGYKLLTVCSGIRNTDP